MRLFERVILDVIGRYVPGVDTDALRVDLLHQRATLSNVDLAPPGHVPPTLLFMGVPFAISAPSGLDSLNVSFSGGKFRADASGLVLHLRHIRYEYSAANVGVNDALARSKRTLLAEAERQATGLFGTLLGKFFPLLLDKLQVSVSNIRIIIHLAGGHDLELCMESLRTSSVSGTDLDIAPAGEGVWTADDASHSESLSLGSDEDAVPAEAAVHSPVVSGTSRGGLAKDIVVRGVAAHLNEANVFRLVETVLRLRHKLGEFVVDVRVGDPLAFFIGDALADELCALRRDSSLWEFAAIYRRPRHSPMDEPNAWWRFAVRVIMRSTGCGHIEADQGRSRLRRCVEYHRLHLERLKRGNRTPASTLERCRNLEEVLDVETVLLLRSRARNAVRAEEAAQFAAEDWLGWMLIGDGSDVVGRKMTTDIREAMNSLETQDAGTSSVGNMFAGVGLTADGAASSVDAVAPAQASWTHAVLSVSLKTLTLSVLNEEDDLRVDLSATRVNFRAEVDSPFTTFTMDASIANFKVTDGHIQYVRLFSKLPNLSSLLGIGECKDGECLNHGVDELREAPQSAEVQTHETEHDSRDFVSIFVKAACEEGSRRKGKAEVRLGDVALYLDVARMSPVIGLLSKLAGATRGLDSVDSFSVSVPLITRTPESSSFRLPFVQLKQPNRVPATHSRLRVQPSTELGDRMHAPKGKGMGGLSPNWLNDLVLTVQLPGVRVILSSGLDVSDSKRMTRGGLLLDFTKVELSWAPFSGENVPLSTASASVSLTMCTVANDVIDDNPAGQESSATQVTDADGFIRILSVSQPFFRGFGVRLCLGDDGAVVCSIGEELVSIWDVDLKAAGTLVGHVMEELVAEWEVLGTRSQCSSHSDVFGGTPCTRSAWARASSCSDRGSRATGMKIPPYSFQLVVAKLQVVALTGTDRPQSVALLQMHQAHARVDFSPRARIAISVVEAALSDPKGTGELRFGPVESDSAPGFSISSNSGLSLEDQASTSKVSVDMHWGSVVACLRADFIHQLSLFLVDITDHFGHMGGEVQHDERPGASCVTTDCGPPYSLDSQLMSGPFNIWVDCFFLNWGIDPCRASFSGKSLNVEGFEGTWCGFMDSLEIVDSREGGAFHGPFVSSRGGITDRRRQKRVQFRFSPTFVDVEVSYVRIVLFREFLESLIRSTKALYDLVQKALALHPTYPHGHTREEKDVLHASESDASPRQVHLKGSSLFLVLPVATDEEFEAGLDIHRLSVVFNDSSFSLDCRKISVLTSSFASGAAGSQSSGNQLRDWCVMLGPTEFEVKRVTSTGEEREEAASNENVAVPEVRRQKEEWQIRLLQEASLLLTKRQVESIRNVFVRNLGRPSQELVSGKGSTESSSTLGEEHDNEYSSSSPSPKAVPLSAEVPSAAVDLLYKRVIISVDAPGIIVELLPEQKEGRVAESVSTLSVGAIRYVSEVFSESQAPFFRPRTSVTRMVLDVAWLCVRDMRPNVPGPYRLVVSADPNGATTHNESIDDQNWAPVSFLHAQVHLKEDQAGLRTSKTEVRVLAPQIMWRPELLDEINTVLFEGQSSNGHFSQTRSGSCSSDIGADEQEFVEVCKSSSDEESPLFGGSRTVVAKISILVESPQLFLVEAPLCDSSRGVEVAVDRVKISILLDSTGSLVGGSQIRVRGVQVSSCSANVLSGHEAQASGESTKKGDSSRFSLPAGQTSREYALIPRRVARHSIAATNERAESVLRRWAFDVEAPVVLFRIKSVHVRPPSADSSAVQIYVPHVVLDGTVHDCVAFLVVAPLLGIVSGQDPDMSGSVPVIHAILREIECIIRVPQHRIREFRLRSGGDGSSLVRAKIGIDVRISEDLSLMEASVEGKGVRAYDGQTGVWDRRDVVESFTMYLNVSPVPRTSISIYVADAVRINLSPLIVKVLANLVYAAQASVSMLQVSPLRRNQGRNTAAGDEEFIIIACSLSAIEMCLKSETLRVKAVVTSFELQAEVPRASGPTGQLAVRVGDVYVVNESLRRRSRENGRDWSMLLSHAPEIGVSSGRDRFRELSERIESLFSDNSQSIAFSSIGRPSSAAPTAIRMDEVRTGGEISLSTGRKRRRRDASLERVRGPAFAAVIQLGSGEEHDAEMRFGVSGLDVCLDADVAADLVDWAAMLSSTLTAARELHERPVPSPQDSSSSNNEGTGDGGILMEQAPRRSCHVVVESVGVRFSARAPSPSTSAHSLSLWRVAERLLGSEYVSDITLLVPKVDTVFQFRGTADIVSAVGGEYRVGAARPLGLQIARQTPAIVSLARVGMLSLMRHGEASQKVSHQSDRRRVEGLLEVTDESNAEWERRQCIRERVSLLDSEVLFLASEPAGVTGTGVDRDGMSFDSRRASLSRTDVLDIAGGSEHVAGRVDDASGIVLFELLRQRDDQLRATGGRYKFFVHVMPDTALLITDKQVLILRVPDHEILEPRLSVAEIAGYSVPPRGQPRIIVHFVVEQRRNDLSQMRRDTVSMLAAMQTRPPFTLLCGQRDKAEWLAAMLPTANAVAYEFPDVVIEDL